MVSLETDRGSTAGAEERAKEMVIDLDLLPQNNKQEAQNNSAVDLSSLKVEKK